MSLCDQSKELGETSCVVVCPARRSPPIGTEELRKQAVSLCAPLGDPPPSARRFLCELSVGICFGICHIEAQGVGVRMMHTEVCPPNFVAIWLGSRDDAHRSFSAVCFSRPPWWQRLSFLAVCFFRLQVQSQPKQISSHLFLKPHQHRHQRYQHQHRLRLEDGFKQGLKLKRKWQHRL